MALVTDKDKVIDVTAVTDPSYGDGVTGLQYGDAAWIYYVKEMVKDIGGSVTASSTRTSGTGDTANAAANSDQWSDVQHVCYASAWVGFKMPAVRGTTRRICIQRGAISSGQSVRIKINWSTDYTGGTATQTPTVSGEEIVHGGGTDASPTFDTFCPSTGNYILQALGYSDSPQCFAVAMYPSAGGIVGSAGLFFAIDALEDSSYISGCDDAVLVRAAQATPTIGGLTTESALTSMCFARARLGLTSPSPTWEAVKMLAVGSIPGSAAAEPRGNKKPIARIKYARDASPADSFGLSRLFRWYGPVGSVPQTANLSSTKDLLVIGQITLPWDGTEPA